MRLLSYLHPDHQVPRSALLHDDRVIDIQYILGAPRDMLALLRLSNTRAAPGQRPLEWLDGEWTRARQELTLEHYPSIAHVKLLAPLPNPTSLRDFYAFEAHVQRSRARRGLDMMPEWYDAPAFYFSNHQAICGPEQPVTRPPHTQWLDFELEVAAIIGREGRDMPATDAGSYIAGYTIMNDWSARDSQRQEMKVGLGPAKGKDFATSLGPLLVTPDEIEERRNGKGFDLFMVARRNGREISRGNWSSIYFSFEEMIARASEAVTLYPGDIIGSGTVGSGCILEQGPDAVGGWLQPGDCIELEIERLGTLRSVVKDPPALAPGKVRASPPQQARQ
jgi:2-keto-4-pentenoate hydratase/2-oxohepta-3-ene-1,7-dioic acid hydratase in catechol pathway